MTSTRPPKAVLYTFQGSLWGSVPSLCLVEKGYSPEDYEVRQVNLMEGENFAPTYLRVNSKGTVPSLVVPIGHTTGQEVDTKFRALNDSIEIVNFLDSSRSQSLLEIKGEDNGRPAPILSPATIEGKAISDSLIALVHSAKGDGNTLLMSPRTEVELNMLRKSLQGTFCRNRQTALEKYKAEAMINAGAGGENPRTAHMNDNLVKWYNDKLAELAPLHAVYLKPTSTNSSQFVQQSRQNWHHMIDVLQQVEEHIEGPFALGDQIALADLHILAFLARFMAASCQLEGEKDEIVALEKALKHDCLKDNAYAQLGLSTKLKTYWTALKSRPSFETVYGSGLH